MALKRRKKTSPASFLLNFQYHTKKKKDSILLQAISKYWYDYELPAHPDLGELSFQRCVLKICMCEDHPLQTLRSGYFEVR